MQACCALLCQTHTLNKRGECFEEFFEHYNYLMNAACTAKVQKTMMDSGYAVIVTFTPWFWI